jgi:uncharacterized protein
MIPTREDCLRLMFRYGMLEHIIDHSIKVARVALVLSSELNRKGQSIDLALVESAALLHDLTKTECLRTKEDHALTGSRLLREIGFERVGDVIAEHIQLVKKIDPSWISEEEVVNYADKRVRHDRIVSLEERFEDLKGRYGKGQRALELLEELRKATLKIERKIFSILEIEPNHLEELLPEADDVCRKDDREDKPLP